MTNFRFLLPEFKPPYEPAKGAEQLVHSDPRACCMRTRHALERAVHWLYENDRDLRMPYDTGLGVRSSQSTLASPGLKMGRHGLVRSSMS